MESPLRSQVATLSPLWRHRPLKLLLSRQLSMLLSSKQPLKRLSSKQLSMLLLSKRSLKRPQQPPMLLSSKQSLMLQSMRLWQKLE